nr:PTS transporter subunit EIIC [Klebsiella pneumoniae subsp. pneumoniae]
MYLHRASGGAIFDNLALIFAIGVASSWSKDNAGSAALAGAVGYFVMTKRWSPSTRKSIWACWPVSLPVWWQGGIQPLGRHQAAGLPELLRRQTPCRSPPASSV